MMKTKSPMRVLYVECSIGGVLGGSLTGFQHLFRGLDRRQVEPIMVLYEEKTLQAELEDLDIRVRIVRPKRRTKPHPLQRLQTYRRLRRKRLPSRLILKLREVWRFGRETIPAALALARIYKEEQPHLVHLGNNFNRNLDGVVAAWWCGIPCVCHVKGFEKFNWIDRLFSRTVDLGICMTDALLQHCRQYRMRAKHLTYIYDGLDTEGFRPACDPAAIRKEFGIPSGAPIVGIAGHIQSWKGQAVVVEAIREVRAVLPDIRCLIVGGVHQNGQAYAEDLQRYVQAHGLQDQVIFTGFRDDVPDLMAAMDMVIHASVNPEPFGRVIMEGMALGKPVIATNFGSVPEFVQDGVTGRLVPPGDPAALAKAILELYDDAAYRERLGNAGRQEVQRRFTMEHHVQEITKAYANVVPGMY